MRWLYRMAENGERLRDALKNTGLLLGAIVSISVLVDWALTPGILRRAREEAHRMDLESEKRLVDRLNRMEAKLDRLLERE